MEIWYTYSYCDCNIGIHFENANNRFTKQLYTSIVLLFRVL